MSPRNILLLGGAGSGKTTVLQKTMALLPRHRFGGFFVRTLPGGLLPTRRSSPPRGYREPAEKHLVLIQGRNRTLTERPLRRGIDSAETSVVDPTSLIEEGLRAIEQAMRDAQVVVVDDLEEIASIHEEFRHCVIEAFQRDVAVLATARSLSPGWLEELSRREDTLLLEIGEENRSVLGKTLANQICQLLREPPEEPG